MLTPKESEVRVGGTAKLECSATGDPTPVIAWKKDGGDDFPAARERRFQVMDEESEIFFISNVKVADMGVYSCTATNAAGVISANATLTVLPITAVPQSAGGHRSAGRGGRRDRVQGHGVAKTQDSVEERR